jgi:HK97 family phage prohead protease/HK97 family phage major capsid protein
MKYKDFKVNAPFSITEKSEENENGEITISGYASTDHKDRDGDVILASAWKGGIKDFKNNPVILAFHDHRQPIGKAEEIGVDEKGLKITAKISKAAGSILDLIKEGVLSTFSVGFRVKDADYDKDTNIFVIKKAELFEVSVVSVPANAKASFSVVKNFESDSDYEQFKAELLNETSVREIEEIQTMTTETKSSEAKAPDYVAIAASVRKQVLADLAEEKRAADEKKAAEDKAIKDVNIAATTAAERLFKDAQEIFATQSEEAKTELKELRAALEEKASEMEELLHARESKMTFTEDKSLNKITTLQKDAAVLLAKLKGVRVSETDYFNGLIVEKSEMNHWRSDADLEWEMEYSTRVESEMRNQLVVEPLIPEINMTTPTLNFPINPEAGTATWIPATDFRSTDGSSTGANVDHEIYDKFIVAHKLATKEYIGYEELEDSIVTLMPIINDAVSRRMANSSDAAILAGADSWSAVDPIKGLTLRGKTPQEVPSGSAGDYAANLTEDVFVDMRRDLGIYGLDPATLRLLVAHDLYYEIMKLDNFKTVDKAGQGIATLFKGQVGSIWGIPIIVTQGFDNAAITAETPGTPMAVLFRPANFIKGNLRGIVTETDRNIEDQRNIIVTSRRFAFDDIITDEGCIALEISS